MDPYGMREHDLWEKTHTNPLWETLTLTPSLLLFWLSLVLPLFIVASF